MIGEGTKIDNLVQIGHNCRIGRNCLLAGMVGLAGSTILEDSVMIGRRGRHRRSLDHWARQRLSWTRRRYQGACPPDRASPDFRREDVQRVAARSGNT